jgi:LysM repeat protein
MKPLLFLLIFLTYVAMAQEPSFTDFVAGTAQAGDEQVAFYLENVSTCVLEEIQVRIAPDKTIDATTGATFITRLQPKTQGTFVMRLSQTPTNLAWTVDTITLGQPQENPTCPQVGPIAFKKASFGGAPQPTAQTAPAPEINRAVTREYTVVAGDSWWGIAQRFGTTPEVMSQLNGRSNTELKVGEIIKVPAPAAPPALTQTETARVATATSGSVASGGAPAITTAQGFTVYTVKQGDTLFGIAQGLETTVELIRQANCLTEASVLSVNQSLQVPPKDAVLTNTCN